MKDSGVSYRPPESMPLHEGMDIHPIYPQMNLFKRMQQAKVCPYLLRNTVIDKPIRLGRLIYLYSNPTRISVPEAVIDWYSCCIVGWEVDDTLYTRMVITALEKRSKLQNPEFGILIRDVSLPASDILSILSKRTESVRAWMGKPAGQIISGLSDDSAVLNMKKPTWHNTITSKKPELQLDVISTVITSSDAIQLLIIRHQRNTIIRQCCCLMQRKVYMDLRRIFLGFSSVSTISVHYKNLRFLSGQLSHYIQSF